MSILKLTTFPFRKYVPVEHMVDSGEIALGSLRIRSPLGLSSIFLLDLPLGTRQFLVDGEDIIRLDNGRIDADAAVLGFFGMREGRGHGIRNVSNGSRAERDQASIVDCSFLFRDVKTKEAIRKTCRVG